MELQKLVNVYKVKYPQHGFFDLNPDESINDAVRHYNVPEDYGVYFITAKYKEQEDQENIVYIGKSGTIMQNGEFKNQTLRERLTRIQDGERRRDFFIHKMNEMGLDCLTFNWFLTWTESIKMLPVLAEAEFIQAYWEDNKVLPLWNKCI